MDHAGMEQDREDLARYRAGLPPLVRKEIHLDSEAWLTAEEAAKRVSDIFVKALNKSKRRKT